MTTYNAELAPMNAFGSCTGGGALGGGVDEARGLDTPGRTARWRRRTALSRTSPAAWHGTARTQPRIARAKPPASRQQGRAVVSLAPVQLAHSRSPPGRVMVVRIRLARFGRKNLPFYRIFVADSRSPRDGRHIEVVGHFDPITGARAGAEGRSGARVVPGARQRRTSALGRRSRAPWFVHAFCGVALSSLRAGKDGNKHLGLNFDRIKCGRGRRAPPQPRCGPAARRRAPTLTLLRSTCAADARPSRPRRARYWLSVGAQPSDRVARLLGACAAPTRLTASRGARSCVLRDAALTPLCDAWRAAGQVGVLPMPPRPFLVEKTAAPRTSRQAPATAAPPPTTA